VAEGERNSILVLSSYVNVAQGILNVAQGILSVAEPDSMEPNGDIKVR
jgi:hypothetical protein